MAASYFIYDFSMTSVTGTDLEWDIPICSEMAIHIILVYLVSLGWLAG